MEIPKPVRNARGPLLTRLAAVVGIPRPPYEVVVGNVHCGRCREVVELLREKVGQSVEPLQKEAGRSVEPLDVARAYRSLLGEVYAPYARAFGAHHLARVVGDSKRD